MHYHNGDIQDTSNLESSSFLQVNSCGIQYPYGGEGIAFRRNGRVDYHIVYVLGGTLEVAYPGQTQLLRPGSFVLYPPRVPQQYRDFPDTHRAWIHFNGHAAADILREARLTGGIYHAPASLYLEKMFLRLVTEHNACTAISSEKGLLLSLLSLLGKTSHQSSDNANRLEECASYLVQNYNKELTVGELAALCGLSQSRFMYLFKERFGMAPMEYQKALRLSNAKALLTATQLPINEISTLVGYPDPLYFSRLFRQATGLSPRQYRAGG